MRIIKGYSEFLKTYNCDDQLRLGVLVDTNILVAATYDLDPSNTEAAEFLDLLLSHEVPIFCNVNIRNEFLEIHRRILFTEALLDFESEVNKASLPETLRKKLNSIRTRSQKPTKENKSPFRLSEAEIKDFKMEMVKVKNEKEDLWSLLCEYRIGNKLSSVWKEIENESGLIFLSARKEELATYFVKEPNWEDVVSLMSNHGVSSSDAMIINMFLCSKFVAMLSSDRDVAFVINKISNPNKYLFLPDRIAKEFN